MKSKAPPTVWIGLTLAVLLDIPAQLVWKALMIKLADPTRGPTLHDFHHQAKWIFWQARSWELLLFFFLQFINWIWVLGNADLSYAQPFTALSYVAVSACAAGYFHEHLSPMRILGIGLILIGVMLVGSTEHRTMQPEVIR